MLSQDRAQRSKSKKRPRRWHAGATVADKWHRVAGRLPDLGTGADPCAGSPGPLRRVGNRNRGDAA